MSGSQNFGGKAMARNMCKTALFDKHHYLSSSGKGWKANPMEAGE